MQPVIYHGICFHSPLIIQQWWAARACKAFSTGLSLSEALTYMFNLNSNFCP